MFNMNIMFLIFSFNIGGIERLLIDLCNNMVLQKQHVYLCIINHDYTPSLLNELSPEVTIIYLNRTNYNLPSANKSNRHKDSFHKYMLKLSIIVRQNHIQILHCQGINCVLFSAIAKLLNPSVIVLNTVHDSGNYPSYSSAKIFLQNRICSMTIAISNSVQEEILSRHISASRVTTIYNAIDTDKFQYDQSGSNSFNPDSSISIGNVARFYPAKKGQDILVKAVELLIPKYPSIHCYFAGEIFKNQENEYNKLISYIEEKKLENHFTFLGNVNDIPAFLKKIDIFVLPSNYEGFGISLIEAMATGLPCIASSLEGPKEIIASPDLGILFKPGSSTGLACTIEKMICNYNTYDKAHISESIKSRFNISNSVQSHLSLYKKLLSK